jgi:hypothetical protein
MGLTGAVRAPDVGVEGGVQRRRGKLASEVANACTSLATLKVRSRARRRGGEWGVPSWVPEIRDERAVTKTRMRRVRRRVWCAARGRQGRIGSR